MVQTEYQRLRIPCVKKSNVKCRARMIWRVTREVVWPGFQLTVEFDIYQYLQCVVFVTDPCDLVSLAPISVSCVTT